MTDVRSSIDTENLTLTFVADFDAPPARIWQVWADPRQLERWWGPPTYPATFDRHDLSAGGESRYHMTGPDGNKSRGWWRTISVDEPSSLEFEDGFAGDDGEPSGQFGSTRCRVTLAAADGGTRMTTVSTFASLEQLEEMVKMGMQEGMTASMGQIDELLAAPGSA